MTKGRRHSEDDLEQGGASSAKNRRIGSALVAPVIVDPPRKGDQAEERITSAEEELMQDEDVDFGADDDESKGQSGEPTLPANDAVALTSSLQVPSHDRAVHLKKLSVLDACIFMDKLPGAKNPFFHFLHPTQGKKVMII